MFILYALQNKLNAQQLRVRDEKFHEYTTYQPNIFKFIAKIR